MPIANTEKACPNLKQYQQLASGQLSEIEAESLLSHLENCDPCAQKVKTLAEPDTLVGLLRQADTVDEEATRKAIGGLIERLSKLRPEPAPAGTKPQTMAAAEKAPPEIRLACSGCGKSLKVKGALAGKKVKCPHCQAVVPVPNAVRAQESSRPPPLAGTDALTAAPASSAGGRSSAGTAAGQSQPAGTDQHLYDFLAPAQAPDELGRLGPYRVLKVLGAGGMGVVFQAEDPHLQRLVALKAMLPGLAASESAKQRFLREARAAAALKHDHIVTIHQVGEDRGAPFLAMEFLEGEPLEDRLKREGKLPLADVLRIGREMAEGLAAAHERGLIHRDIKPANVWLEASLARKGGECRVKILDFGLARAATGEAQLTQPGAIVGTPAYMAPEQAAGKNVDPRSDLFSLGCVLYRMATGESPFRGTDMISTLMAVATENPTPPVVLDPALPQELSDLVMKLLEKDMAQRLGSANEAVKILQALEKAEGEPGPVRSQKVVARTPDRATAARRRKPVGLIAIALLAIFGVLVLGAGGIVFYWQTNNGTVRIEINDPDIQVSFNKKDLLFKGANLPESLTVGPGEYGLHVKKGDLEFDTDKPIIIKRGDVVTLKIDWLKGAKLVAMQADKVIGQQVVPPAPIAVKWALQFDGTGYVRVDTKGPVTAKKFTVEAWVNPAGLGMVYSNLFDNTMGGGTLLGSWARKDDGSACWAWNVNKHSVLYLHRESKDTCIFDKWVHVAGVYDGSSFDLYLNGRRQNTPSHSGSIELPLIGFYIGKSLFGDKVTALGKVSAFRISKVARYDKDCTPAPRFEPDADTLALYHFDEGSGDVLKDSSGNGHHGKIIGAKWVKADGTALAPAPPDESAAKKSQEDWAAKLKLPVETTNKIGMKFVLIPPAGKLIPAAYYLGKYEVRQKDWEEVMGYNPSQVRGKQLRFASMDTGVFPVETVSWYDSVEFCNKLSEREAMPPYYELKVTKRGGKDGKQIDKADVKILGGGGYHVPTEVEWEHGCRAGTWTRYHCGDKDDELLEYAWIAKNSEGHPHAVGGKKPNAFGLHDMHGNVWEYTEDNTRGGCFGDIAATCVVNNHAGMGVAARHGASGLRVARAAVAKESAPLTSAPPPHRAGWIAEKWLREVAALPAAQQVAAVKAMMPQRNPGFARTIKHQIVSGVVTEIQFDGSVVQDLSPLLAFAGLETLDCSCKDPWQSPLVDLSPLAPLPLRSLRYPYHTGLGAEQLRSIKTLQTINDLPAAAFRAKVDGEAAEFEIFRRLVAALTPQAQGKAVAQRMKDRNPGFDGKLDAGIDQGVVVAITVPTDAVVDVSAVRALPGLQRLNLHTENRKSKLADLTPLQGMKLTSLNLFGCDQVRDLTPLQGMPLTWLSLACCVQVRDLTPLQGMPLTWLSLNPGGGGTATQVSDLTPLKGMPLTTLDLSNCYEVRDLTPLKGMPLTSLELNGCGQVRDILTPLKGMPLNSLGLNGCNQIQDLSPLRGMPLKSLSVHACGQLRDLTPLQGLKLTLLNLDRCSHVQNLTPLKGMPLTTLLINDCPGVRDVTALDGMSLEFLQLTPKTITKGIETIRQMKSLKRISMGPRQFPPDEFWKKYDAKEFSK